MELLSLSDEDMKRAAGAIRAGLLVAFPTETVYGLGGDAFNPSALAKIFEVKKRPRFDPLIIHIAGTEGLDRVIDLDALDPVARKKTGALCRALWPGPLTLILPKRREVPDLATSGLSTAAVRFPSHQAAQKLIALSTGAVAAPSANPFGCLSPTRAEHVLEQLGEGVDFIIDGGPATIGVESTVLDLSSGIPRILRPGGTSRERIEAVIGKVEFPETQDPSIGPLSPGRLKSHYAPRTPLAFHRREDMVSLPYNPDEAYLFFDKGSQDLWLKNQILPGRGQSSSGGQTFEGQSSPCQELEPAAFPRLRVLSEAGDLTEAAAGLFNILHEMDKLGAALIRAEEVPPKGLGPAINDRLRRAAAAQPQP
jgi:L-threonylcarbamoyladenylate synthase